jgi:ABC-type multidrug transport system fused ATPase/permease subunit
MTSGNAISSKRFSTFHKVWHLIDPAERRSSLFLLTLMFIGMALETLGVGLVVPALALLTQPDQIRDIPQIETYLHALGDPDASTIVIWGILSLVIVYFVKSVFLAYLGWRQARLAYDVQARLSQRLFRLYLYQPYTFHLQRNSAELIRNAMNEVAQFTGNAMIPGMQLLTEGLVVVGLCALLLVVEPLGALVVVSVLGVAAWAFHQMTRGPVLRWGKQRLHHDGLRIQHLQQGLGGAKDVKLLGREAEFLHRYRIHNLESARVGHLQKAISQLPRLWLEFLAVAGLAALVLTMLAQGRALPSIIPSLGLFAAAAFRLMPSANRLISAVQSLRYGLPVLDTLHNEVELEGGAEPDSVPVSTVYRDTLETDHLTYTYPGAAAPALNDLSVAIRRGETVGFIGASGAGKSTLVDVLLGLLQPDRGEVRVDGVSIRGRLRSWQDQIGYVPQSIFLTDDTLRRNVAFGLPDSRINDTAVHDAIRAAQLENFVGSLPDGLETMVGERGIRLSGGQRQRIGIARALYHDPEVLVLDEATSSLDVDTESDVMEAVRALHGTKTILIVAHRLSTVEACDRLFRLQAGRAAEVKAATGELNGLVNS